jgi:hypothetical protein
MQFGVDFRPMTSPRSGKLQDYASVVKELPERTERLIVQMATGQDDI